MPPQRLVLDGLWHCLCPSSARRTLGGVNFRSSGAQILRRRASTLIALTTPLYRRTISLAVLPFRSRRYLSGQKDTHYAGARLEQCPRQYGVSTGKATGYQPLAALSTEDVYERAEYLATLGQYENVRSHVQRLLHDRHEPPNLRLYSMLILSLVDPVSGSVPLLQSLLSEMRADSISPDSRTYHNILKVLAIHPDYLLRTRMLQEMNTRWYSLTTEGHHDYIASLLRERQYEIALHHLSFLATDSIPIQPWLIATAIYLLLTINELDEALLLLRRYPNTSPNAHYAFLDAAARQLHYEGVLYVWRTRVETGLLHPPQGICEYVLSTAARQGDATLATDVFRLLGNRSAAFKPHHYEALMEAMLGAGELRNALTVPYIMIEPGRLQPDERSMRGLVAYLQGPENQSRREKTLSMLQDSKTAKRRVPLCVVNALMEARVHAGEVELVLELYRTLHTLCDRNGDTQSFNLVFRTCCTNGFEGAEKTATFYREEMKALRVQANEETYETLIEVALIHGRGDESLQNALSLCFEMKKEGLQLGVKVGGKLAEWCVEAGDQSAWLVLDEIEDCEEKERLRRWTGQQLGARSEAEQS